MPGPAQCKLDVLWFQALLGVELMDGILTMLAVLAGGAMITGAWLLFFEVIEYASRGKWRP